MQTSCWNVSTEFMYRILGCIAAYGEVSAAREVLESRVGRVDGSHIEGAGAGPTDQTGARQPDVRLVRDRRLHPHREEARTRVEHRRQAHGAGHNDVFCERNCG